MARTWIEFKTKVPWFVNRGWEKLCLIETSDELGSPSTQMVGIHQCTTGPTAITDVHMIKGFGFGSQVGDQEVMEGSISVPQFQDVASATMEEGFGEVQDLDRDRG